MVAKPDNLYLSADERLTVETIRLQLGLNKTAYSKALGLSITGYGQMCQKQKVSRYILPAAYGVLAQTKIDTPTSNTKFMLEVVNGRPKVSDLPQQEEVDYTKYRTINLDGEDFYLVPFQKKPTIQSPAVRTTVDSYKNNGSDTTAGRTTFYPKANPGTKQDITLAAIRKILREKGPTTTKKLGAELAKRGMDIHLNRLSSYITKEIRSESPSLKRNYETGEVYAI